jgi:phosphotransferase system enzyme I (PtsP)
MLEVPSLLFQIEEICGVADFISVGSNDLMQFLFAVDRENRMVANRFDPLSAPALRALRVIAETAQQKDCPVTVCGEIGGKPLEALALIALGFRGLSMAPTAIGPVKAMLLALDTAATRALLREELDRSGGGETLRPQLARFAEAHGIPV